MYATLSRHPAVNKEETMGKWLQESRVKGQLLLPYFSGGRDSIYVNPMGKKERG